MNDRTFLTVIAMICITILEIMAVLRGIDGQLFATVISILAGLGGYHIGRKLGGSQNEE